MTEGGTGSETRTAARRGVIALVALLTMLLGLVVLADRVGPAPQVPPYPRQPSTDPDPVVGLSAAGIERPAAPDAVAPDAERQPVAWTQVRTAGDDRHLVLALDGVFGPPDASSGPSDPCADDVVVTVRDTTGEVTVEVERIGSRAARAREHRFCSAAGYFRSVAVELPTPLAGRTLRDATDPEADRTVLDTATVPLASPAERCATTGSDFGTGADGTWVVTQQLACPSDDGRTVAVALSSTDHLVADTSQFFPAEWAKARREVEGIPVDLYEIPAGNPSRVVIAHFPDTWVRVAANDVDLDVLARIARGARAPIEQ